MRKTDCLLLIIGVLVALALAYEINRSSLEESIKDDKVAQKIADDKQNERLSLLEKEVRLLKTDIHILQNGYEGE